MWICRKENNKWFDGALDQIAVVCDEIVSEIEKKGIITNKQSATKSSAEEAADFGTTYKKFKKDQWIINFIRKNNLLKKKVKDALDSVTHILKLIRKNKNVLIDFCTCLPKII